MLLHQELTRRQSFSLGLRAVLPMHLGVAQFLCKVKTDEEVKEYSGAFLQLYREEGFYLERTCHYVERVGLDHVKAAVLGDAGKRRELYERLLFALQDYEDPWTEAVAKPAVRREYQTIVLKDVSGVTA